MKVRAIFEITIICICINRSGITAFGPGTVCF